MRALTALGLWAALAMSTPLTSHDQQEEPHTALQTVLGTAVERSEGQLTLQRRATPGDGNFRDGLVRGDMPAPILETAGYWAGQFMGRCLCSKRRAVRDSSSLMMFRFISLPILVRYKIIQSMDTMFICNFTD